MTYGFGFWRSGYSCLIPWHYQAPCGNPFNDFDSWYGDWCVAYPGPDGPIPTQRWEAISEGIDDYRYVYTLQRYIEKAEAAGVAVTEVKRARTCLKEIWDSIEPAKSYVEPPYGKSELWSFVRYQEHRRRIADHIAALVRATGPVTQARAE